MHNKIKKIFKLIDKHKIISFDIFDTLLLRPYVRPTDLFLHMESHYNLENFAIARIQAEEDARKNLNKNEITLNDIYNFIGDRFKYLKQCEIEWETKILQINPEIKEVYDYAIKQNKKIIVVSDMYLDYNTIDYILKKNNCKNYEKLYVSSEYSATKSKGDLYKKVIDDYSMYKSSDIIHIGDNYDYKKAKENNIDVFKYKTPMYCFLKEFPEYGKFLAENNNSLNSSVITSLSMLYWINTERYSGVDYWEKIGYLYGGVVAYGYCKFIQNIANEKKLDKLLFIARDGYSLQKVFNLLNIDMKTSYIYAPRLLNLICRLDYDTNDYTQVKAVADFYAKEFKLQVNTATIENCNKFINENYVQIKQKSIELYNYYKNYLKKVLDDDSKIGIVDTVTINFSAQKLIENSIKNSLWGIYWIVEKYNLCNNFSEFSKYDFETLKRYRVKGWIFIEFLLSSSEYPIIGIDNSGNPIYNQTPNKYEKFVHDLYEQISKGEVEYTKKLMSIFGNYKLSFDYKIIVSWINCFIKNMPKNDINNMRNIKLGDDMAHTKYIPMFSEHISFCNYLLNPLKTKKEIKSLICKSNWQKIFYSIISPIKFQKEKYYGTKLYRITILPHLEKCLLAFKILNIEISVGNKIYDRL
ncbi:MAG: hypothetical protein IKO48_01200 [Elusimicrobia bacterium]|nr:hypothetical protein [Elusimicrobiota bacterium]